MDSWSFDILRQTGYDLWLMVCVVAALGLLLYVLLARLWTRPLGLVAMLMAGLGIAGTVAVVAVPRLHSPFVGLAWTFLLLCLLSGVFYINLLANLSRSRAAALLAVRVVALAMLVPMLFEPVLRFVSRPKPEKPLIFLVDASGSMSFPDVQNGPTRIASVWQTLRSQLPRVGDHFVARYYVFGTDTRELKKPDELSRLSPDAKATDIVKGVSGALADVTRDDAQVILISDGIDNVSPDVVGALRGVARPVHAVRVGSEQAEPATLANVAIDNVEASDDFVVDHESKIRITVKSSALANRVVDVKLAEVDKDSKPTGKIQSAMLVLQPVPEGQVVEISFKPATVGVQRLAAWVDPIVGERSTVDNRQEFQGLALNPRIKVLYVEGRVRPEYKDLNRALARDPNIEVASLLRIQADRFAASGSAGGEPVAGLPATADEWKRFDVVILGDLDSSFLTKLQQTAIERFAFNGGGLLMIGGQNSFGPGGYKDTPVEQALPVFVGDISAPQEKTPFVPQVTLDGERHPAMEGLVEWFGTADKKGKELPPLRGNVVVAKPKAGAQVLLVHAGRPGPDGQPQIVLATMRYGQGRSAAFTADTTYLWYLPLRGLGQDSPYNRFWGQLTRYLAGEDVRTRQKGAGIDGLLNKSMYQLGESVRVRAMVRDDKGDATRYAQVNLTLRRAGDKEAPRQIPLNPVESRTGLYDVTIPNPDKGDYTIELSATKDNKPLGKQELKFTVIPPAEEMLKIAANPKLLASIAQATGGYSYELAQLPVLIDQLIRADTTTPSARQETLALSNVMRVAATLMHGKPGWPAKYDLPMQAALVAVLLAAEWMLRRRWQLP